jgi:hypothetical protein
MNSFNSTKMKFLNHWTKLPRPQSRNTYKVRATTLPDRVVRGLNPGERNKFFLSHTCPEWLWAPFSLLCNGYWIFSLGKAARGWRWQTIVIYGLGQGRVKLHLCFPCLPPIAYSGATSSFNFPKIDQPPSSGLFLKPSALQYYIHSSLTQSGVKYVNTLFSKDSLRNTSSVTRSFRGGDGVSPPYKNNRHIISYIHLQNYEFFRTVLFWVIKQQGVVISYLRFGTTYRSQLDFWRTYRNVIPKSW